MEKTITVNGHEIKLKTNAGLVRRYRAMFGRNITTDMINIERTLSKVYKEAERETAKYLQESGYEPGTEAYSKAKEALEVTYYSDLPVDLLEIFEDLAYCMNKYADPSQPDNIDDWLEQFDTLDIYQVFPELLMLWSADNETTSNAKKN